MTKAQKHRKNLQRMATSSSAKKGWERLLWSSYSDTLRKDSLSRIINGIGNALAIFPSKKPQLPTRNVKERLERSWYRTGVSLYLAMDEYDSIANKDGRKDSKEELAHAAMK